MDIRVESNGAPYRLIANGGPFSYFYNWECVERVAEMLTSEGQLVRVDYLCETHGWGQTWEGHCEKCEDEYYQAVIDKAQAESEAYRDWLDDQFLAGVVDGSAYKGDASIV